MNQKRGLTILFLALIAVFTVHLFNQNTESLRADLTENQLYSLTGGTKDILKKMNDEGVKPVEIQLYFSETTGKTLPRFIKNFITYQAYVENLLREYARASDGKITVEVIDPKPDSDQAQDAADYGLDGKAINEYGDLFYFGMVFTTQTGTKDVIDFLWPEKQDTIEYEISKKLYNLLWPTQKRIAVLAGLDVLPDNNPYMAQLMRAQGRQPTEPWISMRVLQESYEVTRLDQEIDEISKDDYDLLVVIHPKGFSDKQFWLINQWVATGGGAIFFLDAYSIEDQAPENPNQPWAQLQYQASSDMTKLLDAWGLKRPDHAFAVDFNLGYKGPIDRRGTMGKNITDLVVDDKTAPLVFNQEVPIFNGLVSARFYLPGLLETKVEAPEGVTYSPLIKTTDQGSSLEIKPGFGESGALAYTDLNSPNKLLDAYSPSGEQVLAYMVTGQVPSAFPEGASFAAQTPQAPPGMPPGFQMPPDENAEMIQKEAIPAEQLSETRFLVFADTDFISDRVAFSESFFGVTANNDNHKILLNAVDYLLGAEELMNVRAKSRIRRPFEKFDQIEAQADKDMLAQEQKIRTDIERFQEEVREKQRGLNQQNAVLFQKKLADEVAALNEKIREGEKQLREIRKQKRALLEGEENLVRFSIMWLMPIVVCLVGIFNGWSTYRRKNQRNVTLEG